MTIRQINWETGNENSHALVDKICIDCGGDFSIPANIASKAKRCPNCKRLHANEMERERNAKKRNQQNNRARWNVVGDYQIQIDPSDSWGFNSCLDKQEVTQLIRQDYIETGTVFQHSTGKRFWVLGRALRELA